MHLRGFHCQIAYGDWTREVAYAAKKVGIDSSRAGIIFILLLTLQPNFDSYQRASPTTGRLESH